MVRFISHWASSHTLNWHHSKHNGSTSCLLHPCHCYSQCQSWPQPMHRHWYHWLHTPAQHLSLQKDINHQNAPRGHRPHRGQDWCVLWKLFGPRSVLFLRGRVVGWLCNADVRTEVAWNVTCTINLNIDIGADAIDYKYVHLSMYALFPLPAWFTCLRQCHTVPSLVVTPRCTGHPTRSASFRIECHRIFIVNRHHSEHDGKCFMSAMALYPH